MTPSASAGINASDVFACAVVNAATQLLGESVHVLNGDTFLRYSLEALEDATIAAGASAGVALARVADAHRYGAVDISGGKIAQFREHRQGPGWIERYYQREGEIYTERVEWPEQVTE